MHRFPVVVAGAVLAGGAVAVPPGTALPSATLPGRPGHVVVATLDTGANLFHPAFRRAERRHPSAYIPGYPKSAKPVRLRLGRDQEDDVVASEAALDRLGGTLTYVPGTNIVGAIAHPADAQPVYDPTPARTHHHGAAASSQIAGAGLGFSAEPYLVIVDRTPEGSGNPYEANAHLLRWAADQPWIDVIHTNIQNPVPLAGEDVPGYTGYPEAVQYAVSKGKLVVSAGGNFYAEPTETSPHAGPPGVLVAGANDNCGYTEYSNPDPHVVADGFGTVAADSTTYGRRTFSGTSSASPRITGYVATLILALRRATGQRTGMVGDALVTAPRGRRPATGPLRDGRLTAAELHEVVRKTANPLSHASAFDGTAAPTCVPQATQGPYLKMGYGEVSEHTFDLAYRVALGKAPLPARPDADPFYEQSERLRRQFWP